MAFYTSAGHGGFGDTDIFLTRRIGPAHREVWAEPLNLGPAVNTAAHETSSSYLRTGRRRGVLYFNRNLVGATQWARLSTALTLTLFPGLSWDGRPTLPASAARR